MFLEVFLFCVLLALAVFSYKSLLLRLRSIQAWHTADRIARRHEANSTVSDSFVNTTYVETESGIFPGAPPPYSHVESPPKYEDIIKIETAVTIDRTSAVIMQTPPTSRFVPIHSAPPPYTISV